MLSGQASVVRKHNGALRRRVLSTRSQSRNFRTALWSSYLDPIYQKEIERRHKVLKHKYAEAVNRKLSWDSQGPSKKVAFKSLMCPSWFSKDSHPGGRWMSMNEIRYNFEQTQDFGTSQPQIYESATISNGKRSRRRQHTQVHEVEYTIDPISGRKIFKSAEPKPVEEISVQIPVKPFRGYRSQFSAMQPPVINLDGPPMQAEEMRSYRKPYQYNEPNGRSQSPKPKDLMAATTEDLERYRRSRESLDADGPPMTEQEIHFYRNPVTHNEPDGKPGVPDHMHEPTKEDLELYRERQANLDPDGPPMTADEIKSYQQPVLHNEPDGQPAEAKTVDPLAPTKEELDAYRSHENDQVLDPDAPALQPEELDSYDQPFLHNEPDGKPQEESSQDPLTPTEEELDLYRRSEKNSPSPAVEETTGKEMYDDLDLYRSKREPVQNSNTEGAEQARSARSQEPAVRESRFARSVRLSAFHTEDTDRAEDLDLLRPSDIRAASGIAKLHKQENGTEKAASRAALEEDFEQIQVKQNAYAEEVAAAQKAAKDRAQELEIERSELLNHVAHAKGKVDARIAELRSHEDTKENQQPKLTGNYVRDFPEEFSTTWTAKGDTLVSSSQSDLWGYAKEPQGLELSYQQEKENGIANEDYQQTRFTTFPEGMTSSTKHRLQPALDRTTPANCDKYGYNKEPCGLETSYKEECIANGDPKPTVYHKSYSRSEEAKAKEEKRAQHRDLVREVRAIYEDKFGTIDSQHRQPKGEASEIETTKAIPTLYKILAYDPTMQEVNMAETTSIVADNSGILTPAEVLLRLSNPAKFFAHFAPLRNDGFEIVSGSGDVLVFKKVREGAPPAKMLTGEATVKMANPVDGTQPMSMASETLEGLKEKFRSGIDVRREEPVFSGSKTKWEDKETKSQPRLAKRLLIGAGWFAACSYAVGVASEFFMVRGADGKRAV